MLIYQSENSSSQKHLRIEHYTNFFFVPNFHKDLEFALVWEGEVTYCVPGHTNTIAEGQCALFLSNQVHSFSTPSHSRVLVVNFSPAYVGSFMREVQGKTGNNCVFHITAGLSNYLSEVFPERKNTIPDELTIKACAYALCAEYLKQIALVEAAKNSGELLHGILEYVEGNFNENISMKTMSASLGYDENYLSRYFHKHISISFRNYLNQYRISHACELLENGKMTVSEIAFESGFQSIRSFNRVFKEIMSCTPRTYV